MNCPACDHQDFKEVYKIGGWHIKECSTCGFAMVDPLPQTQNPDRQEFYSKDKVLERFDKKRPLKRKFFRSMKLAFKSITKRDKNKIFYQKIHQCVPEGGRVFDLGCGDGSFLNTLKDRYQCSGIEMSDLLSDLARKKRELNVRTGDFLTADFDDEEFDAITIISVIEHIDDPIKTFKKCFDLLKPHAVLILKTVNYGCLNRRIMKENWTGLRPPDHVIYFRPSNLKLLLKKVGFTDIKISAWPFSDNMYCEAWK